MYNRKSSFINHALFLLLLLLIPISNMLYAGYYKESFHYSILLMIQSFFIILWMLFYYIGLLKPQKMSNSRAECADQQETLMEELKQNNLLLERNIRITDSIFQITSDILTSGEIDEILQNILEKAIEVIPNAQKGSILFYNGEKLEFRAVKGYDFEVLRKIQLSIDEIFLSHSDDFLEPCIINDVEEFNRVHMKRDNLKLLSEGRGLELRSNISCAIFVDNAFYGSINLDNTDQANAFKDEDKAYIKHLANQIGIALKNAKLIEKAIYLSRNDSLTGIYNRRYFEELLMKAISHFHTEGTFFSLVIFDINDLKYTNDTHGHEAGDMLIKRFATVVSRFLSEKDIFARYGGDEFAAVFVGKTAAQVLEIMQQIQAYFESKPFTYCARKIITIRFGFGIAEFPDESKDQDSLLRLADGRMYENKRICKNCS